MVECWWWSFAAPQVDEERQWECRSLRASPETDACWMIFSLSSCDFQVRILRSSGQGQQEWKESDSCTSRKPTVCWVVLARCRLPSWAAWNVVMMAHSDVQCRDSTHGRSAAQPQNALLQFCIPTRRYEPVSLSVEFVSYILLPAAKSCLNFSKTRASGPTES